MKTRYLLAIIFLLSSQALASPPPQGWEWHPRLQRSLDGRWITEDGEPYTGTLTLTFGRLDRHTEELIGEPFQSMTHTIVDGRAHGKAVFRDADGVVERRMDFKEGKRNGLEEVLTPCFGAHTCTAWYRDGFMHGESKGFDQNGRLLWMVLFEDGIPASFKYDGTVVLYATYSIRRRDDGLFYQQNVAEPFTGVIVEFYRNGVVKSFSEYKRGRQHGLRIDRYPSGNMKFYCEYRNGEKHGACLSWTSQGEMRDLNRFSFYLDGKVRIRGTDLLRMKLNPGDNTSDSEQPDGAVTQEPAQSAAPREAHP